MRKKTTIGIPRAGFFYLHFPFWKAFFENLGFSVVASNPTNKKIFSEGLKKAESEICLPVKIYFGHVSSLIGKVDYILAESYLEFFDDNHEKGWSEYMCPYFVAMVDVLRANFSNQNFLSIDIKSKNGIFEIDSFYSLCDDFGFSKAKVNSAYQKAIEKQAEFEKKLLADKNPVNIINGNKDECVNSRKIAVVGRPYVLYDTFGNVGIIEKLREKGFDIVTNYNLSLKTKQEYLKKYDFDFKKSHWFMTNELMGAIKYFSEDKSIAGILYLIPFSCGPDSMVNQLIKEKIMGKKPFTTISVDESSGDAGIMTRLEAFIDILGK